MVSTRQENSADSTASNAGFRCAAPVNVEKRGAKDDTNEKRAEGASAKDKVEEL